jgi:hypothetical protein
MRNTRNVVSIGILLIFVVAVIGGGTLAIHWTEAKAQTPPAPCACSRATPIVAADDVTAVPGQLQARYGVTHCQCGAATCVSQVAYGSAGIPQLFCVK